MAKDTKGITVKRDEDFSEWYTQLITKAELIEYSPVSGCYILRPRAYHIWEKAKAHFNKLITDDGVENSYFPLFIPESLLTKEEEHVEGFAPEVAWVETGGHTKLNERLAVRPTSETIIYDSYSKWIRSHKDLPLRLNQWCNVVRWEFQHCTPFLRSREFLWQEGHTVFATKEEAEAETFKILDFYKDTFRDVYALPVLTGKKSNGEKFAGADYSLSTEAYLPNGKAIQAATSHHLGQNFAKAFDIKFTGEDQKVHLPFQNSWGFSTRSIGMMIIMHSDDKGLVLPPKVAKIQVVIVPILRADSQDQVLAKALEIKKSLEGMGVSVSIDDRSDYSPGWKFNEWELKGVPVRIELGPRDLQAGEVPVARRDNGVKENVAIGKLSSRVPVILGEIHTSLYMKAEQLLQSSIFKVSTIAEAKNVISEGKLVFAQWCGEKDCEEQFKEKTGAKSLNMPLEQEEVSGNCFACPHPAKYWFYFGKSY